MGIEHAIPVNNIVKVMMMQMKIIAVVILSDRLKMKSEIDSFQLGRKSSPHRWARPRTL